MLKQNISLKPFLILMGAAILLGAGGAFIMYRAAYGPEDDPQPINYYFNEPESIAPRPVIAPQQSNNSPRSITPPPPSQATQRDDLVCIQVITPAVNITTREVRDFPTPCDVPPGWEPITQ